LSSNRPASAPKSHSERAAGSTIECPHFELEELADLLKSRDAKLAQAQHAQATVVRKQRELEEREREPKSSKRTS
jgi:hypothetical protein